MTDVIDLCMVCGKAKGRHLVPDDTWQCPGVFDRQRRSGKPLPRYHQTILWSRIKVLEKEQSRVEKGIDSLNIVIRLMEERSLTK